MHEWLAKSNFSFLKAASSPEALVQRAAALGYSSLCLNDFGGVYGLPRAYQASKALPSLRLHYGIELNLQNDHHRPLLLQDTIALIALNHEGYYQLNQLASLAHQAGKDTAMLNLDTLLAQPTSQLVAVQPMRGALRASSLHHDRWAKLKDVFVDRFYQVVSLHLHPAEDAWLARAFELAQKWQLPLLYSQDVFFAIEADKPLHDVLQTIRTNATIATNHAHFFANAERHLHARHIIQQRLRQLPGHQTMLANSETLHQRCHFSLAELRYEYPKEMIPPGYTAQTYLTLLTRQGAYERFGTQLTQKTINTLTHELNLIERLGFADYFLTVWDIVRWARSQNILCQGRGSAANSAVCFVLGITSVDPTCFDLLFERFISLERGDPPDIDVDFEHERREEVIQYIYRRYGRARAAMVANIITFRSKGALRAVGKALGIPEAVISKTAKTISSKLYRGQPLGRVLAVVKDIFAEETATGDQTNAHADADADADTNISTKPTDDSNAIPWQQWLTLAQRLIGFPRHLGLHSGGFVIFQNNLNGLCAQEPATMPGRTVIQWCKDDIENLGIFKIDVLCLGMLTAIRKSFAFIEEHYQKKLTLYSLPSDDPATFAMIRAADTIGVFQIESRAQMSMLPRLKPRTFYDLVIEIAIVRPGPIQGRVIHPYLRRRSGIDPIIYPDKRLRPILERTLGIAIFQEQAMRIAIAVGGFTAGEANELRKNIGAWNMSGFAKKLEPWLVRLEEGMRKNGLAEEFVAQIRGQMRGFAEYGFPESHAASFAHIAYASSYLKCHYPAAFFAGLLNAQPMGFYSPHALLQAARRAGVPVLPLCVQHSQYDHQLEWFTPPSSQLQPQASAKHQPKLAIRLGMRLISGLRTETAHTIARHKPYSNLHDLVFKTNIYRDDLLALASTNALQALGLSRSEAIWQAAAAPFAPLIDTDEEQAKTKNIWRTESELQKICRDFQSFGTSLGEHPALVVKQSHWQYNVDRTKIILARDLKNLRNNQMVTTFGMTLVKQAPPTAKGMVFLSVEDETEFLNLVFTPQVYRQFYQQIEDYAFLCTYGQLQKAGAGHSILVKQVFAIDEKIAALHEVNTSSETKYTNRHSKVLQLKPRSYI